MRKVLVFLVLISLGFIGVLIQNSGERVFENVKKEVEINLSTNKEVYKQGEKVFLNVSIFSQRQLENVVLLLSGIETRFGKDYLNLEKNVKLERGKNTVEFSFNLPYCNACSGVSAGKHQLKIKVVYENETIGFGSKTVEIK